MLPHKKVLVLLFCCAALVTLYFCDSGSSTGPDPDPEPITLEGEWEIKEFGGLFFGYYQLILAPDQINAILRIQNDKFWENGRIFDITFVDSGTIYDEGDSIQFISRVYHRTFRGKIVDNALVINKTIANQFAGLAIYKK